MQEQKSAGVLLSTKSKCNVYNGVDKKYSTFSIFYKEGAPLTLG
jgi:hypothetical protein